MPPASGIEAASDVEALVNTSTEIWLVCIAEAGKLLTLVCRQCPLLGNPVVLAALSSQKFKAPRP